MFWCNVLAAHALVLISFIYAEMKDIKVIDDNYWGHYDAVFMTDVKLPVKPAIKASERPKFMLKFNKPLAGMELYQANVIEAFNNNTEVLLQYRLPDDLPEGDFQFKAQVHCIGEKEECPTQMDVCFFTPKDQANLCNNHEDIEKMLAELDKDEDFTTEYEERGTNDDLHTDTTDEKDVKEKGPEIETPKTETDTQELDGGDVYTSLLPIFAGSVLLVFLVIPLVCLYRVMRNSKTTKISKNKKTKKS